MARAAIETINPLGFLEPEGHFVTQRIQEIHFFGSAVKSFMSIASTGQSCAQREHFVHSLVGFGTRPAPLFFIRAVTRNGGASIFLGNDSLCKGYKLLLVILVRSSCSIFMDDGVLSNAGYGCNNGKAALFCCIFHLDKGIFIGSVSIDGNKSALGSVSLDSLQSFDGDGRSSSTKGWHGDQNHILFIDRCKREVFPWICQVDYSRMA